MLQEPEELESGVGAGTQDVTELDAWQKCGALAAVGMTIDEVPHITPRIWSADACASLRPSPPPRCLKHMKDWDVSRVLYI